MFLGFGPLWPFITVFVYGDREFYTDNLRNAALSP